MKKSNRLLSPEVAMKIKRLYAEKDQFGRGKYSQMAIARLMGCGETTVHRILKGAGAYQGLPELAEPGEAEASLEAFKKKFPEMTGAMTEDSVEEAATEILTGLDKLAEAAAEHTKSDRLVEELKGKGPVIVDGEFQGMKGPLDE